MPTSRSASPPLVFVHGFLGFHHLRLLGFTIEYFRHLKEELLQQKVSSLIPALPAIGTIEERATALAAQVAQYGSDRFILVGHSMGGLDSRYLTHSLDPNHRVEQVITLGAPHWGSVLPRWLLSGDGWLQRLAQRRWRRTLEELTPRRARASMRTSRIERMCATVRTPVCARERSCQHGCARAPEL